MRIGDLIRWTDYRYTPPTVHVGLLIKSLKNTKVDGVTGQWHDLLVICDGEYKHWTSWQCEVVNG